MMPDCDKDHLSSGSDHSYYKKGSQTNAENTVFSYRCFDVVKSHLQFPYLTLKKEEGIVGLWEKQVDLREEPH